MSIKGYIQNYDGETLTIVAPFSDDYILQKQGVTECEIILDDGRYISADQRKKIHATIRDISLYTGFAAEEAKAILKYDFIARTGNEYFSCSDTDMTTAYNFIQYLVDFCIENDIPTKDNLVDYSPDVGRYVYKCLVEKKSCVSRQKAELHHVDAVGAGRNRKEIVHKGMRVLPLTRKEHSEIHSMGYKAFCEKYHVFGIKLDDYLCDTWKLKKS